MATNTEGLGRVLAGMLIATSAACGLAACAGDDDGTAPPAEHSAPPAATHSATPSDGASSQPAYKGAYDAKFREWAGEHEDSVVALTGTVKNVVNDNAFTLAGENDAEDFLVVSKDNTQGLTAGGKVSVRGVVHKAFDLPGVEDNIDVDFDDDDVFEGFDRDPYIVASNISVE